jgi:hypothetical protein
MRARERWEKAVRQAARYRVQYEISDPNDALGERPEHHEQRQQWERAREALERIERRLGRGVDRGDVVDRGLGI